MARHEIEGQSKLIRELRANANITQAYVAERLGMNRHTYEKYEVGVSVPSQLVLLKLSKLYDTPIQAFFEPFQYLDALHHGYAYVTNDLKPVERLLIQRLRNGGEWD